VRLPPGRLRPDPAGLETHAPKHHLRPQTYSRPGSALKYVNRSTMERGGAVNAPRDGQAFGPARVESAGEWSWSIGIWVDLV
jgi:hypothetical protein